MGLRHWFVQRFTTAALLPRRGQAPGKLGMAGNFQYNRIAFPEQGFRTATETIRPHKRRRNCLYNNHLRKQLASLAITEIVYATHTFRPAPTHLLVAVCRLTPFRW